MRNKAKISVVLNENNSFNVEVYGEQSQIVISLVLAIREDKDLEEIINLAHEIHNGMKEEEVW